MGVRILFFCGGETFLWKDGERTLRDLVIEAKRIGFLIVNVVTNGTYPIDLPEADLILLSLDGDKARHNEIRGDTYDAIMENISNATADNICFYMAINQSLPTEGEKMRQTTENVSPMSNEGRNAYVVTHLTEALLSLLEEKSIEDITISELVDKAEVGRASFYRNYVYKEDILKAHIHNLLREWTEKYANQTNIPLSEQMRTVIFHFEQHRPFYHLLNERGLIYLLKDVIIGIFGPKPEYEKAQAYATAFVAYVLYGWIDIWFQRGMKETSDEICEMFRLQGL